MTRFLFRFLLLRLVLLIIAPFAPILAAAGICWVIDWLDRLGALDR